MPRVLAIVQARMGSTRLPGKVLMPALGKPLILHMLDRVSRSQRIDELWLATSDLPADDELAATVEAAGYKVFRGDESDVLTRFYDLAVQVRPETVVRLTGDCPLHDPEVIDSLIDAFHESGQFDYGCNALPPTYPDGLDAEVFSFQALEYAHKTCTNPFEREHVTLYIHRRFPGSVDPPEILNVEAPADFSHMRWTLDYPEDYEFIVKVFEAFADQPEFGWLDVVALTTRRPELLEVNTVAQRNEAIAKAAAAGQLN
ncbi:MAG TPA: glycosyltransferase family protein [Fimbriimonadaceae bacterium]|nr:glycosyltransferase family protein [Fimbriimonadaceae bacterium]